MFFGQWENKFFKLVGLIVNDMERINIKMEHYQHSSLFKVLR